MCKKLFPDTNIFYFLIIPQRIFFSCECLMDEYLGFNSVIWTPKNIRTNLTLMKMPIFRASIYILNLKTEHWGFLLIKLPLLCQSRLSMFLLCLLLVIFFWAVYSLRQLQRVGSTFCARPFSSLGSCPLVPHI